MLGENSPDISFIHECWGGVWYLNEEEVWEIYNKSLEVGLKPLNPSIDVDTVGEYFCDLIIYRNQLIRVTETFIAVLQ